MNVKDAIVLLSKLDGNSTLLFEIVDQDEREPNASYSVDEIRSVNGLVILRSID